MRRRRRRRRRGPGLSSIAGISRGEGIAGEGERRAAPAARRAPSRPLHHELGHRALGKCGAGRAAAGKVPGAPKQGTRAAPARETMARGRGPLGLREAQGRVPLVGLRPSRTCEPGGGSRRGKLVGVPSAA